jgi:xanthine dehydrogenase large subunit
MSAPRNSPLHRSSPHESAARHVTGAARYTDDLPAPAGLLHGVLATSPHAHARILSRDATAARAMPGVRAVLFAADIPGDNRVGPIVHDEPVLAEDVVLHVGFPVALVVADTREQAHRAARAVQVSYEPLPAVLGIEAAIEAQSYLNDPHVIARGDLDAAFTRAALVLEGETLTPAQDHFYLETHVARAIPEDGGAWKVVSSTQHPTEVQRMVARVLGLGAHMVVCECPRMGGGFGGKESQAANVAALAAIGAHATGRPVSVWLDRGEDMGTTGKRHPFLARWRAAFAADGRLLALDARLWSDGGYSLDLSPAVMDRALYHLDGSYFLEACRLEGRCCRTHLPSNTAFRGFGGPQGVIVVEDAMERAAAALRLDPAAVRAASYYGPGRDRAPYGQHVKAPRIADMHARLLADCDYAGRRTAIEAEHAAARAALAAGNATSAQRWLRRGIGLVPVKFGISFTNAPLNQAGALVLVYADGTVQLNHGGTEMGQGLHTKMLAVCADTLGVSLPRIRAMNTSTEKVPNTSATAASSGADLNGQAVREACLTLRTRRAEVAATLLEARPDELEFRQDAVHAPSGRSMAFPALAAACWLRQVSLSATGYYRTPGIAYDRAAGAGTPFFYYAYGMSVVEVELNGLTGEHVLRRVDILHDVGDSLVPAIDVGQVEGAFVQGYGWLTNEEVLVDASGRVRTRGPSTYKVPAAGDIPRALNVTLLPDAPQDGTIGGSKAVGEPPLLHGIAVVNALRHAACGFAADPHADVRLGLPATPERLLLEVERLRGASRDA